MLSIRLLLADLSRRFSVQQTTNWPGMQATVLYSMKQSMNGQESRQKSTACNGCNLVFGTFRDWTTEQRLELSTSCYCTQRFDVLAGCKVHNVWGRYGRPSGATLNKGTSPLSESRAPAFVHARPNLGCWRSEGGQMRNLCFVERCCQLDRYCKN